MERKDLGREVRRFPCKLSLPTTCLIASATSKGREVIPRLLRVISTPAEKVDSVSSLRTLAVSEESRLELAVDELGDEGGSLLSRLSSCVSTTCSS